jgi:Holliday junction DNA helicase RuvA
MYDFIEGKIEHANPAFLVLNCNGIGFHLQISINTYEKIKSEKNIQICA